MHPVDPGEHWLEAGITGLARQREWDAVATSDGPGSPGDEAAFVVLADGRTLLETAPDGFDPQPLASALDGQLERPYRALALRRPELWVVGASAIETAELSAERGDALEVVRTAEGVSIRVDGIPSGASLPELEELGAARFPTFVVRAHRLVDALFEVEIEPL